MCCGCQAGEDAPPWLPLSGVLPHLQSCGFLQLVVVYMHVLSIGSMQYGTTCTLDHPGHVHSGVGAEPVSCLWQLPAAHADRVHSPRFWAISVPVDTARRLLCQTVSGWESAVDGRLQLTCYSSLDAAPAESRGVLLDLQCCGEVHVGRACWPMC
jgi:hypothetical protein